MTPKQLRDWTILIRMEGYDYRKPSISDIEEQLHAHADALEELAKAQSALADAERKIERLKFHAEAMYQEHKKIADEWNRVLDSRAISPAHSATAYRAEFREES